jgi:hypothetical protein
MDRVKYKWGDRVCPSGQDPKSPKAVGTVAHTYPDFSQICVRWDMSAGEVWEKAEDIQLAEVPHEVA